MTIDSHPFILHFKIKGVTHSFYQSETKNWTESSLLWFGLQIYATFFQIPNLKKHDKFSRVRNNLCVHLFTAVVQRKTNASILEDRILSKFKTHVDLKLAPNPKLTNQSLKH